MRLADYLSKDELASFRERSDLAGWRLVLGNYLAIVALLALVVVWPNPLSFAVASVFLGGRVLGLGILNHEAAHGTLFRTKALNAQVARWLLAGPIFADFGGYRAGHLQHHRHAGTTDDPDLVLVRGYPATPSSMRRKLLRDLTGRSGLRDLVFLLSRSTWHNRVPTVLWHAVVLGTLALAAGPSGLLAYAAWWTGYIFLFPAFTRIRVMGDHGAVSEAIDPDPRRHTRTTLANALERATVCPNYVNYHCEHHLLPTVPAHNLPALHKLLESRGFYEGHPEALVTGYGAVIRRCVSQSGASGVGRSAAASLANMS